MTTACAAEYESSSDQRLRDLALVLRETNERFGARLPDKDRRAHRIVGAALVREAVRRTYGLKYHDVQILAGLTLSTGHIAEMATGEGKTIVSAIPTFLAWIEGLQTHVATPNAYLAKRDYLHLKPVLERLGCSVALLPDQRDMSKKHAAYQADVIYGTGDEFGFDYLRDQTTLRNQTSRTAAVLQKRLAHMIVDEIDSVLIDNAGMPLTLNERTGRGDRHPTVETSAEVAITCETSSIARIAQQRFYQSYGELSGMTATAEGADDEFEKFYRLKTVLIPRHKPCRRVDLPDRFFMSRDAKLRAIVAEILERHRCGQPVLIGTKTTHDSEIISTMLRSLKLSHQVLNGLQDAEEAAVIREAGRFGAVTVATNMAGRGTDIKPDERAIAVGGLFVIGVERHDSRRTDRQLAGRAGRQGDFGFSRFFVSGDDELIRRNAPKLAARLRRTADRNGEIHDNYSSLVTLFQHMSEQRAFARRQKMVEHDA